MATYVEGVRLHRVVAIRRPEDRIEQIKVQNPSGDTDVWPVEEAIEGMVQGTDAFFVCRPDTTLWSPVTPFPYRNPTCIRTMEDTTKKDDLIELPRF